MSLNNANSNQEQKWNLFLTLQAILLAPMKIVKRRYLELNEDEVYHDTKDLLLRILVGSKRFVIVLSGSVEILNANKILLSYQSIRLWLNAKASYELLKFVLERRGRGGCNMYDEKIAWETREKKNGA